MGNGRRQWHPTPVLLPGKSQGWRRLLGCRPWGREESDRTERLHFHFSLFTFLHWRRKWHPTPVFFPGEPQGRGSLVGCRLWGRTESDTTERLSSSSGGRRQLWTRGFKHYACFYPSDHPSTHDSTSFQLWFPPCLTQLKAILT